MAFGGGIWNTIVCILAGLRFLKLAIYGMGFIVCMFQSGMFAGLNLAQRGVGGFIVTSCTEQSRLFSEHMGDTKHANYRVLIHFLMVYPKIMNDEYENTKIESFDHFQVVVS